jgi:hypothetical protein
MILSVTHVNEPLPDSTFTTQAPFITVVKAVIAVKVTP